MVVLDVANSNVETDTLQQGLKEGKPEHLLFNL